jgi:hypothetical protein
VERFAPAIVDVTECTVISSKYLAYWKKYITVAEFNELYRVYTKEWCGFKS